MKLTEQAKERIRVAISNLDIIDVDNATESDKVGSMILPILSELRLLDRSIYYLQGRFIKSEKRSFTDIEVFKVREGKSLDESIVCIIEAKRADFSGAKEQLLGYMDSRKCNFGVYTDGTIWKFINETGKLLDQLYIDRDLEKIALYLQGETYK